MKHYNNKEIVTEIQKGNEEVLSYLSGKYFQQARRIMRIKGVKDADTPDFFSSTMVKVWIDISHQKFPVNIELETFLFNTLQEYIDEHIGKKSQNRLKTVDLFSENQKSVVAKCVSILDESAKNLLHARYAERLSFENIATRFNFSNPVIAQHEVDKAMNQLEGIVKLRINISVN